MKRIKYIIVLLVAGLLSAGSSSAQTPVLGINQILSPSTICTGTCFTVTVQYSVSAANATNVQVKTKFPLANLVVCGTSISCPTFYTSATVGLNTELTFNLGNKTPGSYSFCYQIKFKNGTTCNGTTASLQAEITSTEVPVPVPALPVVATAQANDVWNIYKYINGSSGTVTYGVSDCTGTGFVDVIYQIYIYPSAYTCAHNLNGTNISDPLPAGATLGQVYNNAACTGVPITSSTGTLNWSPGTLDINGTTWYQYWVKVRFPVSQIGQTKCNTATLTGTNPCGASVTKTSNSVCALLQLVTPSYSCGWVYSDIYISPSYRYYTGCDAHLNLSVTNTNPCSTPSNNWTNIGYTANMPSEIKLNTITLSPLTAVQNVTITVVDNFNVSYGPQTYTNIPTTTVSFYAAPYNVPAARYIKSIIITSNLSIIGSGTASFGTLNYTILNNRWNMFNTPVVGTPVVTGNTVTFTPATYTSSNGLTLNCNPAFTISAKAPRMIIYKSLCPGLSCYKSGDIAKFSIYVRNYGTDNLVGGYVGDVLPAGLEYVPNSSTFGTVTVASNPSLATLCGLNQNGTGITVAHAESISTTSLKWNLPSVNAACGVTSDWYVINFQVKITNAAVFGNLPNTAHVYNAGNTSLGNYTAYVPICKIDEPLLPKKEVSADGITFGPSVTVPPGGTVYYRLKVNNPGTVPIKNIVMIDMLPQNLDKNVADCNPRGSNIPIYLTSQVPLNNATTIGYSTTQNPTRGGVADLYFLPDNTVSCNTPPMPATWPNYATFIGSNTIQNARSFRIDYGTYVLGPGQTEVFNFTAQVPPGATTGSIGCNSFGVSAVRQAAPDIHQLGSEPTKVCVTVGSEGCGCIGNFVWHDLNNNGLQDSGEPGINGCTITLYNSSNVQVGAPVISTFDINGNPGYYSFCNIPAGQYYIVVIPPATFVVGPLNNSNLSLNNDVDPNTLQSALFTFSCQTNNDIDVGLIKDDGCRCTQSSWGPIQISTGNGHEAVDVVPVDAAKSKIGNPGGPIIINPPVSTITLKCNKEKKDTITLQCNKTYGFSAQYNCIPASCGSVQIILTKPGGGTVIATNFISFITSTGGYYDIKIVGMCGNKRCDSCLFTFKVVCPVCPCPYQLEVTPKKPTYTSVTSAPPHTVVTDQFIISGPPTALFTEIRAEVLSFTLNGSFNNECLSCKTLPFTWASIKSGTNIGSINPAITMFNTTAPNFTPTTSNTHQNPREIIWNKPTGFTLPSSIYLQFIFPPASIITCCELTGTICVKFTFRDMNCKECEVVVCFPYTIKPGTGDDHGDPHNPTDTYSDIKANTLDLKAKELSEPEKEPDTERIINECNATFSPVIKSGNTTIKLEQNGMAIWKISNGNKINIDPGFICSGKNCEPSGIVNILMYEPAGLSGEETKTMLKANEPVSFKQKGLYKFSINTYCNGKALSYSTAVQVID